MATAPPDSLVRASSQWTVEQYAWLQERSRRLGLNSIAAAARTVVQAAMDAERRQEGEAA